MSDYATLPLQAHKDRSAFLEHAWDVGRAYRHQAIELISTCQNLSRLAPPTYFHEDAELRRLRRVCDLALHSAVASGTKVTNEANERFKEATKVLSNHLERRHHLGHPLTVCSKMEMARLKDEIERYWSHAQPEECAKTMTINFVLLRSPLLSPRDPEAIIMSQEFSASPPLPEILWNFSRYADHARITLEQNPHFYLRCPTDESAYTPMFRRHPLQDTSGVLEHNDTVYVLWDRPSRVFLQTEHEYRVFGNIWVLNGSLIFRDSSGVLEGEKLVRDSSARYNLRHWEQPVVYHDSESRSRLNHSHLRPIVTTPPANPSSDGAFEDWTVLSRPASHSIDIHIYGSRGSSGSTNSLDLPPPPPTSERPEYRVLYKSRAINMLNDDILLDIFNYYRLANETRRNVRLWWCKLSHVCRRWRHLIHSSAFHLDMHILCTNGTPIVDTLDHLPLLPLFIDYLDEDVQAIRSLWRSMTRVVSSEDELGIDHALRLRDRVRRINLRVSPSTLDKSLRLMDKPFPMLEHLSLSFTGDEITSLIPLKTFLVPNLRHLDLGGIRLPQRLRLLSSTLSLVTLKLTNIQASGYFHPRLLAARLESLPQLKELSIGFSIPIPRPSAERLLLGKQGSPVMLSNLKTLTFRGVSAYLERLISQIRAPVLERLDITLFNQIAFRLPHLSHFVNITEQIKSPRTAAIGFFPGIGTSIILSRGVMRSHSVYSDQGFTLRVPCEPLDWQIDCASQICSALISALSGIERLTLINKPSALSRANLANWKTIEIDHIYEIDGTTWHEVLRSFVGVKELSINHEFLVGLSRAPEVHEIGSDPGLLPDLQELVIMDHEMHAKNAESLFGSFIHTRQVAGRPLSLRLVLSPMPRPAPGKIPPDNWVFPDGPSITLSLTPTSFAVKEHPRSSLTLSELFHAVEDEMNLV